MVVRPQKVELYIFKALSRNTCVVDERVKTKRLGGSVPYHPKYSVTNYINKHEGDQQQRMMSLTTFQRRNTWSTPSPASAQSTASFILISQLRSNNRACCHMLHPRNTGSADFRITLSSHTTNPSCDNCKSCRHICTRRAPPTTPVTRWQHTCIVPPSGAEKRRHPAGDIVRELDL